MPSVHFLCEECDTRLTAEAGDPQGGACEACGRQHQVEGPVAGHPIASCAACGCDELYYQKDFNRTTGLVLVIIGAVLVPWTYAISLVVVTAIDFFLYYKLGDVTVCYACRAVHRGYPVNPAHQPFDLATHDRHVYGAAPPGAEEARH
jgi:hypothetical protein